MKLKHIEKAVDKIHNSQENQAKIRFFLEFDWFDKFGSSQKTKFVNVFHEKIFYPGQKIIEEDKNDRVLYVIVSGSCNLVCEKTKKLFKDLEHIEDPTK